MAPLGRYFAGTGAAGWGVPLVGPAAAAGEGGVYRLDAAGPCEEAGPFEAVPAAFALVRPVGLGAPVLCWPASILLFSGRAIGAKNTTGPAPF